MLSEARTLNTDMEPRTAEELFLLGRALKQEGRLEEAADSYRKALQLRPEYFEASNNLGNLLVALDREEEAIRALETAVRLRPEDPEALYNRGRALLKAGKDEEALRDFQEATRLRPGFADAHLNLGVCQIHMKLPEEAEESFRKATLIQPENCEAHYHMGYAQQLQNRLEDAVQSFRRSIAIDPSALGAYLDLGNVLFFLGRQKEALESQLQAVRLKPDSPEAHINLAWLLLAQGDWERGWQEFTWRHKVPAFCARAPDHPLWDGKAFPGKSVLLVGEGGHGDVLHFVRYAPWVKSLGGTVILDCPGPLARLLRGVRGVDRVHVRGEPDEPFDFLCPLMDLPVLFKTTLETVPHQVPYLEPTAETRSLWEARLREGPGIKVGLCWRGSPLHVQDLRRSLTTDDIRAWGKIPGLRFYSFVVWPGEEEPVPPEFPVVDLAPLLEDYDDTAAALLQMDLVISVDTSVAHLAGALGKPVWTLVPYRLDWRWMLDGEGSPWYPTMRLFRQTAAGEWEAAVRKVTEELAGFRPARTR